MNNKSYNTYIKTPFLTKPCPFCGFNKPQLQEYKYDEGGYVVKCPECWAITPVKQTWLSAVDAWENGDWSEVTKDLSEHPRASEEMDLHGALKLAEAILEDAGNEYKYYYRKMLSSKSQAERNKYRYDAERMEERFFKGESIIKALPIDGEAVVRTLQRQVEKEFEVE